MKMAKDNNEASGKPQVVFCDRGVLDNKVYNKKVEYWKQILSNCGLDITKSQEIMDQRYDAVIHMVTAADGAPKFYDFENKARYQTIE